MALQEQRYRKDVLETPQPSPPTHGRTLHEERCIPPRNTGITRKGHLSFCQMPPGWDSTFGNPEEDTLTKSKQLLQLPCTVPQPYLCCSVQKLLPSAAGQEANCKGSFHFHPSPGLQCYQVVKPARRPESRCYYIAIYRPLSCQSVSRGKIKTSHKSIRLQNVHTKAAPRSFYKLNRRSASKKIAILCDKGGVFLNSLNFETRRVPPPFI